jgi:hypothetical protein
MVQPPPHSSREPTESLHCRGFGDSHSSCSQAEVLNSIDVFTNISYSNYRFSRAGSNPRLVECCEHLRRAKWKWKVTDGLAHSGQVPRVKLGGKENSPGKVTRLPHSEGSAIFTFGPWGGEISTNQANMLNSVLTATGQKRISLRQHSTEGPPPAGQNQGHYSSHGVLGRRKRRERRRR